MHAPSFMSPNADVSASSPEWYRRYRGQFVAALACALGCTMALMRTVP